LASPLLLLRLAVAAEWTTGQTAVGNLIADVTVAYPKNLPLQAQQQHKTKAQYALIATANAPTIVAGSSLAAIVYPMSAVGALRLSYRQP